MSTILRGSRLIQNCTPSISYDAQVQSACESFDYQMYEIIDDTGQVVMIPNIMNITDEKLVDILAWQFHVDFYDLTRDIEFKKRLVQMSIIWHKTKGTVSLVEEVINTYWPGSAYLQEWFEYMNPLPPNYPTAPGWHDRYRFRVVINEGVITNADDEAQVMELIDRYKPVSRWPESITHPTHGIMLAYVAAVARIFVNRQSKAAVIRN
jgi:phage tail P2-like protein